MLQKLTIQRVAAIILFTLIFAMAVRIPIDTDTWWHIRSGEYVMQERAVYRADPFSHTMAGKNWNYVGWAAQVLIYLSYEVAGSAGLALYTALLATAGMGFIYLTCAGSVYVRAFPMILGVATAAVFWSTRPHMMSFVLSAALLYLLHQHKRRGHSRALWFIPPLMALWANLHGGFAIGFILLLGSIAGEIAGRLLNAGEPDVVGWAGIKQMALVCAASIGAVCINPYGAVVLGYPFQTVNIGALQDFIQEWASPNFHARETWPFVLLLFGIIALVGRSRLRLDWADLFLVAGIAFMSLTARRNIATFALVATPVLTRHLDDWLDARGWRIGTATATRARGPQVYINLALVLLVLLGAGLKVVAVLLPDTVAEAQEQYLPVRVAEWINEAQPEGLMFNSYNWGGYLMFAMPSYPVFIDGRTDLYDDEFLRAFMNTWHGFPGWEETLDEYGVSFAVIEANGLMATVMHLDADWEAVYEDGQAVVFARVRPVVKSPV